MTYCLSTACYRSMSNHMQDVRFDGFPRAGPSSIGCPDLPGEMLDLHLGLPDAGRDDHRPVEPEQFPARDRLPQRRSARSGPVGKRCHVSADQSKGQSVPCSNTVPGWLSPRFTAGCRDNSKQGFSPTNKGLRQPQFFVSDHKTRGFCVTDRYYESPALTTELRALKPHKNRHIADFSTVP